ncbi:MULTISPECIES: HAL/PAL/TAL family ammonia-lyase [unclassified Agarivorans]|uniref:HAL/PAL/TAL family ammonia-lyase n=1 Tax=unclassified Agarivorans TaxID=2636026 RepID=UPI0026E48B5F|nr:MULTISPECIES: aromatic amino acid ammonia-lyase [unclassified Agarivorans]MDO6685292.1 aromatic amino acid ammonia-lyase [Agarivorans sp. 3_MG-2023]MDO6715536.1 aromatic amino acid ammonia-lyase [Agarivorans sp. 2_MG-2023]
MTQVDIASSQQEAEQVISSCLQVVFGQQAITIEQVELLSRKPQLACLNSSPDYVATVERGAEFLDRLLEEDGAIYGVTTGYGDSCTIVVPLELVEELPLHLTRFHGCGMGKELAPNEARAVVASRLSSLSLAKSGVSYRLLQQLELLMKHDIMPVIPSEGSVGASGDLTPLSYVAAVLMGEREVYYKNRRRPSYEVFVELGIEAIRLRPKEGLAIMNGTAVMTGLACLAYRRAEYLTQVTSRITALASLSLKGNSNHFDELLFAVKPHPGQNQVAEWIRNDLNHHQHPRNSERLQDRYSIRCAPHIIGVLRDALPFMRQFIETELNSANDNPIIDGDGEHVLHGGHFYGGHIAFAMDSMKNAVANLADLVDRQLALLMDEKFNNGLPRNLSAASSERACINHGFKAVQIGASAWTAEALKQTMPASVFSRSTECHNQDKVSMGTIAARDCLRVLELTEQVIAAAWLAVHQALTLRMQQGELELDSLNGELRASYLQVMEDFKLVEEDRPLEAELRQVVKQLQQRKWELYCS